MHKATDLCCKFNVSIYASAIITLLLKFYWHLLWINVVLLSRAVIMHPPLVAVTDPGNDRRGAPIFSGIYAYSEAYIGRNMIFFRSCGEEGGGGVRLGPPSGSATGWLEALCFRVVRPCVRACIRPVTQTWVQNNLKVVEACLVIFITFMYQMGHQVKF